jgi:4-hydroxy-3-methylbut-2-enyl diphosphate reductase
VRSYLIDNAREIRPEWLVATRRIGVTAGASAPETLVQQVIERLRELGVRDVVEMDGEVETTVFRLPDSLATT